MGLAKVTLFFFLSIAFVGFTFLPIQTPSLQGLDFYYITLLGTCVGVLFLVLLKENINFLNYTPGFLVFILIGGLLRYYHLFEESIWLDEYTQYITSAEVGPIAASSDQQQMPLDYLYSAISKYFFKFKELGPRVFSFISGSLSCGFFFLLAQKILGKSYFSSTAALVFCLSPWMNRYSAEGRPIALTIMAGIIFIYVLWSFFEENESESYENLCILSVATFFLFNSTFLQNFIFLFCVNLGFVMAANPRLKKLFKILAAQFIPLVLITPYIWEILKKSLTKKAHSLDLLTLFSSKGKKNAFSDIFLSTFNSLENALFPLLSLLAVLLFLLVVKRLRPSLEIKMTLFSSLFFIFIFSISFFVLVDYHIYYRYSLISYPLFVLTFFTIVTDLNKITQSAIFKKLLLLPPLVFICTSAFGYYKFNTKEIDYSFQTDWKSAYKTLNQYAKDDDIVLTARFDNYDMWRPYGLVAPEFYLKKSIDFGFFTSVMITSPFSYLREVLKKDIKPKSVFLIHFWNEGYQTNRLPEGIFLFSFDQVGVMGSKALEQWEITALNLIRTSKEMGPIGQKQLTLLQLEMELLIHLNRKNEAQQVFNQLLNYDIKTHQHGLFNYYSDWLSRD